MHPSSELALDLVVMSNVPHLRKISGLASGTRAVY
jgi:hypothetical protein